jgi:hypothetical protein
MSEVNISDPASKEVGSFFGEIKNEEVEMRNEEVRKY